ncbi:hypothetical protein TNCV_3689361 [Trichonephila clavipes]|uniref:Uncharacterized protein n=1 Tax=Trichonephila clavipes TaxID=2585209 RepID=A0A8X6T1X3_TRICX|nr:hypothetical protein TNCV_3689361 [Trichonephila clavipes]
MCAAGRRLVGKFMPKFEGPYRVLEVRNNNLITWKKGKKVVVNIDQVQTKEETVQLRGDQSELDNSETLSLLPTEPSKAARRNTRGAKKQWNRQYATEPHQGKEPQHGSLRRRSGG